MIENNYDFNNKSSEVDEITEINILYDFYGGLLSKRQADVIELYYEDNLSLGEIAEQLNISRQAVYDTLKRGVKLLKGYEEILKLVNKYGQEKQIYKSILLLINTLEVQLASNIGAKEDYINILEDIKVKIEEIIDI
ncbi:MAG: YlxM family DNA-binding protein [Thermoanaerobacteraceae bacterium]|nr:YlxM family DNA-binding protein [Thermoanaerobacteraceae bacterium]